MSRDYRTDEEKQAEEVKADRALRESIGKSASDLLDTAAAQLLAANIRGEEFNYRVRAAARMTGLAKSLRNGDFS